MARRKMKPMPSAKKLNEMLRYEPKTGKLFWKNRKEMPTWWNTRFAGTEAFTTLMKGCGYKSGMIFNSQFLAHRIIWKMQTGSAPHYIDHKNGNKIDNRISNLRSVCAKTNRRNNKKPVNTKIHTGIRETDNGYRVQILGKGLGTFKNLNDAIKERRKHEKIHGFTNRHHT